MQAQPADLEHRLVLQDVVVAGQHRRVLGGDRDAVAGIAHLRHRTDVVEVAVRLDDLTDAEALAQLEEPLVLVGGVDEQRVAGLLAPQHEHVVVPGADDDLVDLRLLVLPLQCGHLTEVTTSKSRA